MEKRMLKRSMAVWMVLVLLFISIAPVAFVEGDAASSEDLQATAENENNIAEDTSGLLDETDEMVDNVTDEFSAVMSVSVESEMTAPSAEDLAAEDTAFVADEDAEETLYLYLDYDAQMYSRPNVNGKWLCTIPGPSKLEVIDYSGHWAKVEYYCKADNELYVGYVDCIQEAPTADEAVIDTLYLDAATDLRISPDGLSDIITTIPANTNVGVYEYSGYWAKVAYADGDQEMLVGYVYCKPADETMSVEIFSSRRAVMAPGEEVYLTSVITGFDAYEVSYQWQCDKGNGFEDVEGATGDSYSFAADAETLSYDWRLAIYYR